MQPLQAMADQVHGAYLLIVISEPASQDHKDVILRKISKGFLSWDMETTGCCISAELQYLVDQAPAAEEAKNGEKLVQFVSENLVTEVLINPLANTLQQCMRNLLGSFTRHKHVIHAGYAFSGSGSWIVQDGTYSFADFVSHFRDADLDRMLKAYEKSITVHVHCIAEGEWTSAGDRGIPKYANVAINPADRSPKFQGVANFVSFLSRLVQARPIEDALEASDVVGNIRFSRPTLYVFPGGQGDSSLFGVNGFNMLVDGGFSRKPCFWDFARHLDRVDAVLVSRVSQSNVGGIGSLLKRKAIGHVYPQIGHVFCNVVDSSRNSPDGDKDKDSLLVNVVDEGRKMVANLKQLGLRPQECSRDANVIRPITLYHKVGHGTLDMYVLNPAKDSKEVKEFLQQWQAETISESDSRVGIPLPNLVSICALLIWRPADPSDSITRVLFPGSVPQSKIFEGLDSLKGLLALKSPVCTEESLQKASLTAAKMASKVVRIVAGTPIDDKGGRASPQRLTKATEDLSKQVHKMKEKKEIRAPVTTAVPPPPKIPVEPKRKPSPVVPASKLATNGTPSAAKNAAAAALKADTPRAPPKAKGLKEANNKKTVESKNRTKKDVGPRKAPVKVSPPVSKVEKKAVEKKVSSDSENGQVQTEVPKKVVRIPEPAKSSTDNKEVPVEVEAIKEIVSADQVVDNRDTSEVLEEETHELNGHLFQDKIERQDNTAVPDVDEENVEEGLQSKTKDDLEKLQTESHAEGELDIVKHEFEPRKTHIEEEKPIKQLTTDSQDAEELHEEHDVQPTALIKETLNLKSEHNTDVEEIKELPVHLGHQIQEDQANIMPAYTAEEKHELEAIEDRFLETAILGVRGDLAFGGSNIQPTTKVGSEQREKHLVPDYPKTPDEVAELPIHEVAPTESYEYYVANRGALGLEDSLEIEELQQIHDHEADLPLDHEFHHESAYPEPVHWKHDHQEMDHPEVTIPSEILQTESVYPATFHPESAYTDIHPKTNLQDLHPESTRPEIHSETVLQEIHSEIGKPDFYPQTTLHDHPPESPHLDHPPESPHFDHLPESAHLDLHLDGARADHPPEGAHLDLIPEGAHADLHPENAHLDLHPEGAHLDLHPQSAHADLHLDGARADHPPESPHFDHPPESVHLDLHLDGAHLDLHPEGAHLDLHPEDAHAELHSKIHEISRPDVHTEIAHPDLHPENAYHIEASSIDGKVQEKLLDSEIDVTPPLSTEIFQPTVPPQETSEQQVSIIVEPYSAIHEDQSVTTQPITTETIISTSNVLQDNVTTSIIKLDQEFIDEKHTGDAEMLHPAPSQLIATDDIETYNKPEFQDDHKFEETVKPHEESKLLAEYDENKFEKTSSAPEEHKPSIEHSEVDQGSSTAFQRDADQHTTKDETAFIKEDNIKASEDIQKSSHVLHDDMFELPKPTVLDTRDITGGIDTLDSVAKESDSIPKSPGIFDKSETDFDIVQPKSDQHLTKQPSSDQSDKDSNESDEDVDVLLPGETEQHIIAATSQTSKQDITSMGIPTTTAQPSHEDIETEPEYSRQISDKSDTESTTPAISKITPELYEELKNGTDISHETTAEHTQTVMTLKTLEQDATLTDNIETLEEPMTKLESKVQDDHTVLTSSTPDVITVDAKERVEKLEKEFEQEVLKSDIEEHATFASVEKSEKAVASVDILQVTEKSESTLTHDAAPHDPEHEIASSEKQLPDISSVDISGTSQKPYGSLEHDDLPSDVAEHGTIAFGKQDPDVIPVDTTSSTFFISSTEEPEIRLSQPTSIEQTNSTIKSEPAPDTQAPSHDSTEHILISTTSERSDQEKKSEDIPKADLQVTGTVEHEINIFTTASSEQALISDDIVVTMDKSLISTDDTKFDESQESKIDINNGTVETAAVKSEPDVTYHVTSESSAHAQTNLEYSIPATKIDYAHTEKESSDVEDDADVHRTTLFTDQPSQKDTKMTEELHKDEISAYVTVPRDEAGAESFEKDVIEKCVADQHQDVASSYSLQTALQYSDETKPNDSIHPTDYVTATEKMPDEYEKHLSSSDFSDTELNFASQYEKDSDKQKHFGTCFESQEDRKSSDEISASVEHSSNKFHQDVVVFTHTDVTEHITTTDPASGDAETILDGAKSSLDALSLECNASSASKNIALESIPSEEPVEKTDVPHLEQSEVSSAQLGNMSPKIFSTDHLSTGIFITEESHDTDISNLKQDSTNISCTDTIEQKIPQHEDAGVFQPISSSASVESVQHDPKLLTQPPDLIAASEPSKVHLGTDGDRTRSPSFRRESATSSPLDNIPEVEREDSIEGQVQLGSALKPDFPEVVTLSDTTSPTSPLSPQSPKEQDQDEQKRLDATSRELGMEHEVSSDPKGSIHTSDSEEEIHIAESYIRVRHSPDNLMTASFYDESTAGKDVQCEVPEEPRPFLDHTTDHHDDHHAGFASSTMGDSDTKQHESSLVMKSSNVEDEAASIFVTTPQLPDRQEYEGYYEAHTFSKDQLEDDEDDEDEDVEISPDQVVLSPKEYASLEDKDSEDVPINDHLEPETRLHRQSDDPWRPGSRESGDSRNLTTELRNLPDVSQSPMHSGSYVSAEDSDDERNISPPQQLQYPIAESSSSSEDSQVESARGPLQPEEKYYDIANVPNQGSVAGAGQGAQWTDDYVHVRTPEEDVWQGVHYSSDDNEDDEEEDDDEEDEEEKYYEGDARQFDNETIPEQRAAVAVQQASDSGDDDEYSSGHSLPGFEMDSPQARHTPLEFTNRHAREKHFAEAAANNNLSSPSSGTDDNRSPQDEKSHGASGRVPFDDWGEPMSLPSPPPPSDAKMKPRSAPLARKISSNGNGATNTNVSSSSVTTNINGKQAAVCSSPKRMNTKRQDTSKRSPVYVDLAYVPHHASLNYCNVEFFRSVRARYYVFSGTDPSKEVLDALLEAKGSWEDTELDVTIVPTYDTDTLGYWYALNEHALAKHRIDLAPSASRCTINLQDHETSCSAYRLEF